MLNIEEIDNLRKIELKASDFDLKHLTENEKKTDVRNFNEKLYTIFEFL